MYVAGETLPFAQIQDRFKIIISNVWLRYQHRLPDLDMMVQFDDWMIPNLAGVSFGTDSSELRHLFLDLSRTPSAHSLHIADAARHHSVQLFWHGPVHDWNMLQALACIRLQLASCKRIAWYTA